MQSVTGGSIENEYYNYKQDKVFTTYDLGCAAALITKGFKLVALDRTYPRKIQFIFEKTDEINDIINEYLIDTLEIKARSYFDNIRALKSRIYNSE